MGFAPGRIDVSFVEMVRQNLYVAKVNGVIPWSVIQSDYWRDDPTLPTPFVPGRGWSWEVGKALWEDGKGGYSIEPDYYLYKQVSRAGQAGMAVAEVSSSDPNIGLMAFARNGTRNPDALVIHNLAQQGSRKVAIRITGTGARTFDAYITGSGRNYQPMGASSVRNGVLECSVPARSVITFFARE